MTSDEPVIFCNAKESVVREHVRSVAALAHVRLADVHEGWMALMEVCPTEEFPQLVMFNDYFVEKWFGEDAKISMDMWSVYTETERRTNNHVEGWNSKFMKVSGKHHPNIFQFVDALKREQAATELKVAQHDAAILPPQKKKKHTVMDQHLAVFKQEYDS